MKFKKARNPTTSSPSDPRAFGVQGVVVASTIMPYATRVNPFVSPADRKKVLMALFKKFKSMGDGKVISGGKHNVMLATEGYRTVTLETLPDDEILRLARKHGILRSAGETRENPAGRSVADDLRKMKVGQSQALAAPHFSVTRHSRTSWVLFDSRNRERARWGTAVQIAEDIRHVDQHGTLPPPSGARWNPITTTQGRRLRAKGSKRRSAGETRENPAGRSVADDLRKMKVGQSQALAAPHFSVTRHSRTSWVLFDSRNRERARWGTAVQIAEDIRHVDQHGTLPPPSGARWNPITTTQGRRLRAKGSKRLAGRFLAARRAIEAEGGVPKARVGRMSYQSAAYILAHGKKTKKRRHTVVRGAEHARERPESDVNVWDWINKTFGH